MNTSSILLFPILKTFLNECNIADIKKNLHVYILMHIEYFWNSYLQKCKNIIFIFMVLRTCGIFLIPRNS